MNFESKLKKYVDKLCRSCYNNLVNCKCRRICDNFFKYNLRRKNIMDEKVNVTVLKPEKGKWFEVNPSTINQKLFQKKREDPQEERVRKLILDAFAEAKRKPEKYSKKFQTLILKKKWKQKTIKEFRKIATSLDGFIANWIHFGFTCAQRIQNGEEWNEVDEVVVVTDKHGYLLLVGGQNGYGLNNSIDCIYGSLTSISDVPLIARYTVD